MKTINLKKGFTALELLVVLAIITILIAVALTGIDLSRERSRDNVRVSDIQLIQLGLQQYYDVCRQYPDSIYDMTASNNNGCPSNSGAHWASFMSDDTPKDPNGSDYYYMGVETFAGQTRCIGYHLGADLEQDDSQHLDTDDDGDSSNVTQRCDLNSSGFDGRETVNPTRYDVFSGVQL